ncbi:MAG: ATP-binding protein [Rhodothermales bacterium]
MAVPTPESSRSITVDQDLDLCAQEPIHVPQAIQPHGVLIAYDAQQGLISRVSANCETYLEITAEHLIGRPLAALQQSKLTEWVERVANESFDGGPVKHRTLHIEEQRFDVMVHWSGHEVVIEFEPLEAIDDWAQQPQLEQILTRLEAAETIQALCDQVAYEIQTLTGFARVKIYQFDVDWHGQVVAEQRRADMPSYLGLHFPASDIPPQARRLYTVNRVRCIGDARYASSPILEAEGRKALDMSHSTLRSVAPVHLEYLDNMGVGASMSVSVLQDNQLWGLVACHHPEPHQVPYETRQLCALVGQVMGLLLHNRLRQRDLAYRGQIKERLGVLLEQMIRSETFVTGLLEGDVTMLDLFEAEGGFVYYDQSLHLIGDTPSREQVHGVLAWLEQRMTGDTLLASDALGIEYSGAPSLSKAVSGLLAVSLSKLQPAYVGWFRPEILRTVQWAGMPQKAVEMQGDGRMRLHPRKSFERWQEILRGRSAPWQPSEADAAEALRASIIDVVFVKTEQLRRLNQRLERSNDQLERRNQDLQDFAFIASHDLQEPLRKVRAFSDLLETNYRESIDGEGAFFLDRILDGATRMSDLISDLLAYTHVATKARPFEMTDLTELAYEALREHEYSVEQAAALVEVQILPVAEVDAKQISRVLRNLLENALKFTRKGVAPHIVLNGHEETIDDETWVTITVQDNGIGFAPRFANRIFKPFERLHSRSAYAGTGMGLAICRRIVERHNGTLTATSEEGQGTSFTIRIPKDHPVEDET